MKIRSIKTAGLLTTIALFTCLTVFTAGCAAKKAKAAGTSSKTASSGILTSSDSSASTGPSSSGLESSSSPASAQSSVAVAYATYTNQRYGFTVDYPADLTAKAGSSNGDGKSFASADGSVQFTVSGTNNSDSLSPAAYLKQVVLPALSHVTYQAQGSNYFVVSWTDGTAIGYEKGFVDKSVNTYSIQYPAARKAEFDAVIQHINSSFKAPNIGQYR